MEAEVGMGENSENNVEAGVVTAMGIDVTSMKLIAEPDPVVYKLVRVDGDGRLVPATDDEVMVVEDLLKDDVDEEAFAAEIGLQMEGTKREGSLLEETHRDIPGQSCNPDNNAQTHIVHPGVSVDLEKTNAEDKVVNLVAPLSESSVQIRNAKGCSSSHGGANETGSSASAVGTSRMPDFSKVKGRICLDYLNVKELQETFRATFGRETSVKDKQWLKRRISMGLTNSCSSKATSFMIEDNKVIKISKNVEAAKEETGLSPSGCLNPSPSDLLFSSGNEDSNVEERAAKRVRKPTKRYIEELSEEESREPSGNVSSLMKSFDVMRPCSKARTRLVSNVHCDGKPVVVTRPDSLGGSGIQVPYVSRIRRCRPRENFMSLMPSSVHMSAKTVNRAIGEPGSLVDDERENKVLNITSSPGCIQQPLVSGLEKENQYLESTVEPDKYLEINRTNEPEDNSADVNMATFSTSGGDVKRKHHRPWSLTEVVNLVEGVSKYGAGRWSEIKRFEFAAYSYRTSVDLKDKWRNLLRASSAQLHTENGMQNSRKGAAIPIPASILMRVRELSQMQSQATANLNSSNNSAAHSEDS